MFNVFIYIYNTYYSWLKILDIFPSDDTILSEAERSTASYYSD